MKSCPLQNSKGLRQQFLSLKFYANSGVIVILSALFAFSSLFGGFIQDDYYFVLRLLFPAELPPLSASDHSALGLFSISDGTAEQAHALISSGLAPWWIDDKFVFRLFRPLAELSHALDFYFWPRSPFMMHVHSVIWFLIGMYLVVGFYRRILGNTALAGLASLLCCLDSNLGWVNGWIASRNTVMCIVFGVLTLNHFIDAWRGNTLKTYTTPLLFFIALLCGEFSTSIFLWILAWFICFELLKRQDCEGFSAYQRRSGLFYLPYLSVMLVWVAIYKLGHFGVVGSGSYIDPTKEPLHFIQQVIYQAPSVWFEEIYFFSNTLFGDPVTGSALWWVGVLGIVIFLLFVFRQRKTIHPYLWFFLLASALSSVPPSAGTGGSRVAMFIELGLAPLTAAVIFPGIQKMGAAHDRIYAWIILILKCVMLPLTVMAPIIFNNIDVDTVVNPALKLPLTNADSDRTLIVMNPKHEPASRLFHAIRLYNGLPNARSQLTLASGAEPIAIARPDENSLIVSPQNGFILTSGEKLMRSLSLTPFHTGDILKLNDVDITILSTEEGRPLSARFKFKNTIQDNGYLFLRCEKDKFVPWTAIAVGETTTLPACEK